MSIDFPYRFYERLEPKEREYVRRRVVGRAVTYYVLLVHNTRRVRKILNAAQNAHLERYSFYPFDRRYRVGTPDAPIVASTVIQSAIEELLDIKAILVRLRDLQSHDREIGIP